MLVLGLVFLAHRADSVQKLAGHRPAALSQAQEVAGLPETDRLKLAVGLPLRDPVGLTNLLRELYDPASPHYRQYLTPRQFADRFGPTEADYQAVIGFFVAEGLRVRATHPNRMLLEIEGAVAQIQRALHVTMGLYQHPTEARRFFAPNSEPSLDLAVPILHISGLNNYSIPRPACLRVKPPPPQGTAPQPQDGSGPGGTYLGRDFRAAYAPNVTLTGTGQYVGLLEFDGFYASDIKTYVGQAGMTNVPLITVLLDDMTGAPGDGNVEVALDIEMAISMAPGLTAVIVYEGALPNDILSRMANDNLAKQLSASWTFDVDPTTTQIFQQFAAQGQSYFNSSGDNGAYSGTVSSPTDNPFVTSVGGTTLTTRGAGLGWLSETTWNWSTTGDGSSATGGGISTVFPIPAWQQGINMSTNAGSSAFRNLPDVAMVADNVHVVANNGAWINSGGTSVAAPLWAGFIALVNQQAALNGKAPVGFLNPSIYALGKGTNYASLFHDVKTGNNTNSVSPSKFYACAGYDLCTGWGSPTGRSLINALAPPSNMPVIMAAGSSLILETCAPTNGAIDPGEAVVVSFGLQNIGGVGSTNLTATLLATNGVVPACGPQSYGTLAAGGTVVTRQFTFTVNGSCGSSFSPILLLQDGQTNRGTAGYTLQLGAPQQTYSQNFDTVTAPSLPGDWSAQQTNDATNWVTSSALRDSSPNAAFAYEPTNAGLSELISPPIPIATTAAQVVFRNNFNTEVDPESSATAYDGGVLELQVGSGSWTDILAAGGTFVSGGYNRTIDAEDNPLNGRRAWGGNSGGFVTTAVNLPESAAGQTVQLKWRFTFDNGNFYGGSGWYVDSVAIRDGFGCGTPNTNADLAVSQVADPALGLVDQTLAYVLTITNLGTGPGINVILTDTLPTNADFAWASPGYVKSGATVTWNAPLIPVGRATNFILLVTPTAEGIATNTIAVSAYSFDPNPDNGFCTILSPIYAQPKISSSPTGQVVLAGADVAFNVTAAGTEPLAYQWRLDGVDLPGQTAHKLLLQNVQPADGGTYTVLVTNLVGSALSDPASLRVLVQPVVDLANVVLSPTNVSIRVPSIDGLQYTLEFKNVLDDPQWTLAFGPVTGTGAPIVLQDTNPPAQPTRFYRVNCY